MSALHEWVNTPKCDVGQVAYGADVAFGPIDAHRNLRGPYTAAGTLLRALSDDAHARAPDLVFAHLLALLVVAPELRKRVPVPADVNRWLSIPREGNWPVWTRRIAHGLADFLLAYSERLYPSGVVAAFKNLDAADFTDQEFISVLLRRADPRILRLRVHTTTDRVDAVLASALNAYTTRSPPPSSDPECSVPEAWRAWFATRGVPTGDATELWRDLSEHVVLDVARPPSCSLAHLLIDAATAMAPSSRMELARAHVTSDGTSQRLLAAHLYECLPAGERRALHLARASLLAELDEPSLRLGAIPYHHEQAGGDVETLLAASTECMNLACYDAALDWATRGRRMIDPSEREIYCGVTRNRLFALLLLRRYDEVDALCMEISSDNDDPALLAHVAYARAILNARLYERSRHDYDAADKLIGQSLAFTARVPASSTRAVNTAFLMNTRALVELRKGRQDLAERILTEAISYMAREAPDRFRIESIILWHNLSRLHVITGRPERAADDLSKLLTQEPTYAEAWFDRAVIHQQAGRYEAALADYNAAIRWGPPQVEAHFNRGQTLAALARKDEACAAYDYVLVLDPDFVEARLNRALLRYERGDRDGANTDVFQALRLAPGDARLHCLKGLLAMQNDDMDAGFAAFTCAVEADPLLADPLANRAIISFRRGDLEAALDDLTRALSIREDAGILYNRGRVFKSQRRWREAIDDFERALSLTEGEATDVTRHRDECLAMMRRKT